MDKETIRKLFDYEEDTGKLRWKNCIFVKKNGNYAGHIRKRDGYLTVTINYKSYYVHRLIWLYYYGYLPKEIDHINRNTSDNRLENLREVSRSENSRNKGLYSHNISGYPGVHKQINKYSVKYWARIEVNKKVIHLGIFNTYEEAVAVRKKAEINYRFTFKIKPTEN